MDRRPPPSPTTSAFWAQPRGPWTAADVVRAERQLAMLRKICEDGLKAAKALRDEFDDEVSGRHRWGPSVRREGEDVSQAFERITLRIHRAILLDMRIAKELEVQKTRLEAEEAAKRIVRLSDRDPAPPRPADAGGADEKHGEVLAFPPAMRPRRY